MATWIRVNTQMSVWMSAFLLDVLLGQHAVMFDTTPTQLRPSLLTAIVVMDVSERVCCTQLNYNTLFLWRRVPVCWQTVIIMRWTAIFVF